MELDKDSQRALDLLRLMANADGRPYRHYKISALELLSFAIHSECDNSDMFHDSHEDMYWFNLIIKHFIEVEAISSEDLRYILPNHGVWSRCISPILQRLSFPSLFVLTFLVVLMVSVWVVDRLTSS